MSQKTFKAFVRDLYRENCKERRSWLQEPQKLFSYYRRNYHYLLSRYRKYLSRD